MAVELIDVSAVQGAKIDWHKVKASGVQGVWIQSSLYSKGKAPLFEVQLKGAMDAGLAVGAYHFFYMGSDPIAQVNHAYHACNALGLLKGELPLMFDWEYLKNGDDGLPLTPKHSVWFAEAAMAHADELWGGKVCFYTYPWFVQRHRPDVEKSDLGKYDLVLAAYQKTVPKPPSPWKKITVQQYAGNDGVVPGVPTACDRCRFLGDDEEFRGFLGYDITKPVEEFSGKTIHWTKDMKP